MAKQLQNPGVQNDALWYFISRGQLHFYKRKHVRVDSTDQWWTGPRSSLESWASAHPRYFSYIDIAHMR